MVHRFLRGPSVDERLTPANMRTQKRLSRSFAPPIIRLSLRDLSMDAPFPLTHTCDLPGGALQAAPEQSGHPPASRWNSFCHGAAQDVVCHETLAGIPYQNVDNEMGHEPITKASVLANSALPSTIARSVLVEQDRITKPRKKFRPRKSASDENPKRMRLTRMPFKDLQCRGKLDGVSRFWTLDEHRRCISAMKSHIYQCLLRGSKKYRIISDIVKTRTPNQCKSHIQKWKRALIQGTREMVISRKKESICWNGISRIDSRFLNGESPTETDDSTVPVAWGIPLLVEVLCATDPEMNKPVSMPLKPLENVLAIGEWGCPFTDYALLWTQKPLYDLSCTSGKVSWTLRKWKN